MNFMQMLQHRQNATGANAGGMQQSPMFGQPGMAQKNNMVSPMMPGMNNGGAKPEYEMIDLNLDSKIHDEYGEEFHKTGKTKPNGYDTCLRTCGSCSKCYCALCIVCECGPVTQIHPGNVGFILEFGKLVKKVGAGILTYNICTQKVVQVSIKKQSLQIPGQRLLTQDQLMISCMTYCTYNFNKPELVYFKINRPVEYIQYTTQGIIKALVAERTFEQLQSNPQEFNKACMTEVSKKFVPYGINISSMEIRDVKLPFSMERSMAQVAESTNENAQKLAAAQGYLRSAKSYKQAADSYTGHDIAMELNYYGVLKSMTMGKKSTVFLKDSVIKL